MNRNINNEKKIIKEIINNFFENKELYKKKHMNDNNFLNNKLDKLYANLNIPNNNYYYNLSSYFLYFMKKSVNIFEKYLPVKICNIIKNIVNKLFLDVLELNKHDKYIKVLLNNISNHTLNFLKFLDNYENIDNNMKKIFIKEFLIASYLPIMILPYGKIENFDLWFYITSVWVIFDNIMDIPDLRNKYEMIKETSLFFKNKIYKKSYDEIFNFINNSNEPCLKILSKIFLLDNIDNNIKIEICKRFAKLYKYSYEVKKFKEEKETSNLNKIVEIAILKCKKSLNIFKYALNANDMNEKEEYNICLIVQLMDDFVDLIGDNEINNNTLFINKKQDKIDKIISLIILLENINKYIPELNNFYLLLVIAFSDYNSKYLDLEYVNKLKKNVNIDFQNCNVTKILELMGNLNFVEKGIKIYLSNDLVSNDYYKLNEEDIIKEISYYYFNP